MEAATLSDMEARAAVLDATAAPVEGQPSGSMMNAPMVPTAEIELQKITGELTVLLSVFANVAGSIYPKLQRVWTESTVERVGAAAAKVAQKHGWAAGFLGRWEAEIGLTLVLVPLVGPTLEAMREPEPEKGKPADKPAEKPAIAPSVTGTEAPAATEDDVLSRSVRVAVNG